jgi:hypothetical protein
MTNEVNNVDGILIPREQAMLNNGQAPVQPIPEVKAPEREEAPVIEPEIEAKVTDQEHEVETDNKQVTETDSKQVTTESPIDEYGNPTEKPKMYTQEEVERMMRERLSRGRHTEQPTKAEVNEVVKDFKADPNSAESWEQQLEEFVEKTIEKRQAKLSEKQWREEESIKQADFEAKFTTGMNKYNDFHDVVRGKPIDDVMMLATRNLKDPAAFIYGASKLHPQELQRISGIKDPYQKAAEIGALHEKMIKNKNLASKAGKPLEAPKGDLPTKTYERPSLEYLIDQHGKQKLNNRRR